MEQPADSTEAIGEFGHEIYGPGKQFFDDVVLDNLMEAFLELSATVWMYHDRTLVLERVLESVIGKDQGLDLNALIETHQPTDAEIAARKAEREQMIDRVFKSFAKRPL